MHGIFRAIVFKYLDLASIKLVEKYQQFLEQLEGAFAKAFNQSSSTAFDSKQAAAAIGQIELANHWQQTLKKNKINSALSLIHI